MNEIEKRSMELWPHWIYIKERHANIALDIINKKLGVISKKEYTRIYTDYVSPYFSTWDLFSCCMNCDMSYPPVMYSWYAETLGVKPKQPIKIVRAVFADIFCLYTNYYTGESKCSKCNKLIPE